MLLAKLNGIQTSQRRYNRSELLTMQVAHHREQVNVFEHIFNNIFVSH